jgi:hypothetical protein
VSVPQSEHDAIDHKLRCPSDDPARHPAGCPVDHGQRRPAAVSRSTPHDSRYLTGGAAFPEVEFVPQGEGVTLVLDGKTDIKKGITYSRFESTPDAPFTSFETVLPAGPHSALTAFAAGKNQFNVCQSSLAMPTVITAQNGAVIKQTTKVAVTGCPKAKAPTRAQKLAKALRHARPRTRAARSATNAKPAKRPHTTITASKSGRSSRS